MKIIQVLLALTIALTICTASMGAVPQLVNYQGMLTDSAGTPVANGVYTIRLRIYDDSTAGSTLWDETMPVEIIDGLFSVRLGEGVALPNNLFSAGVNRFLGVKVNLNAEFIPRTRLTSATYALQSLRSDSAAVASLSLNLTCVDCVDASDLADNSVGSGNIVDGSIQSADIANNSVGSSHLVDGSIQSADIANNSVGSSNIVDGSIQLGDIGQNSATTGKVIKWNGSNWSAQNDSTGAENGWTDTGPVVRLADSTDKVGIGISPTTAKLHVNNSAGSGEGILGSGYNGVRGNGTNFGVIGATAPIGGSQPGPTGVWGIGGSYGLYGSGSIYAVYGVNGSNVGLFGSNNTGVYGLGTAFGVHGQSTAGTGVYGRGFTAGDFRSTNVAASQGYGLIATNGGNAFNFSGYFEGEVQVTGFLTKSGGGFKIDHPTDPANKYLIHSFVESPDMKNIYDGVVTINESGEALVTLPDWFDELNRDFRYQLTAIGAPGPNLYVAQKISTNQFRIAGGVAGMEVSWQVTGIRHDVIAEANRLPVEKVKSAAERGKYLHPKEHGVSETLGMLYEMEQKNKAESKRMDEEHAKMEAERKLQEDQSAKLKKDDR